jgi:hypothetical protein
MVFSRFLAMTLGNLWGVQNCPDFLRGHVSSLGARNIKIYPYLDFTLGVEGWKRLNNGI